MSCRTKTLYVLMYIAKSDTDLKKMYLISSIFMVLEKMYRESGDKVTSSF